MDVVTGTDTPDDRDLDEGGLDLTPRDVASAPAARTTRRRWLPILVLVLLGVAVAAIAWQARGASMYFKNADQAVRDQPSLGTKRFRIQGTVFGAPQIGEEATNFKIQYNGVTVLIHHTGSEPAMFKSGVPVVAEGHWNAQGTRFDSDRLLIKHDADYQDYDDKHPERVDENQSNGA